MNENFLLLVLIIFEILFLIFISYKFLNNKNLIFIFFEPIIAFNIGSLVVYFIIPFFMIYFDFKFHKFENYSEQNYFYSNLLCFFYVILVIIFYLLMKKKIKLNKNGKFKFNELKKIELFSLIIFILIPALISTLLLIKNIYSYGLKEYLDNRIILRKGKGLLVLLSYLSILLLPMIEAHILIKIKKNKTNKYFLYLYVLLSIFFVFAYIFMGNRLPAFIIIILSLFSYWIIYLNNLNIKYIFKIFIIFISLIFLFTFAGFYRLAKGDLDKINNKYTKNFYKNVFEYAIIKNFGNYEHLVWLIKHDNRWEPLYGKTYIAGIMNFVPRKIYPEKLLGGGPHLKNIINPGSYNLYKSNITSYTTGVIIEAYMNFKFFGILIVAFFHSLILILLKKFSFSFNNNIILLSIYLYLFFSVSFLIMFSEFLGLFTKSVFLTIPFFLLYIFFNSKIFEEKYKEIIF